VITVVGAYFGARLHGASAAAVALPAGGSVNAALAGWATYRVIGPVPLTTTLAPILSCVAAGVIGLVVTQFGEPTIGAVAAVGFYAVRAASQWSVTRLILAWQGRLD
jgi:hypothetical protein